MFQDNDVCYSPLFPDTDADEEAGPATGPVVMATAVSTPSKPSKPRKPAADKAQKTRASLSGLTAEEKKEHRRLSASLYRATKQAEEAAGKAAARGLVKSRDYISLLTQRASAEMETSHNLQLENMDLKHQIRCNEATIQSLTMENMRLQAENHLLRESAV